MEHQQVSTKLHLIKWFVIVLSYDLCEELKLTTGACHDWGSKPDCSHKCKPSALSLTYPSSYPSYLPEYKCFQCVLTTGGWLAKNQACVCFKVPAPVQVYGQIR